MLRYSLRDLLRNPRRTLASAVGVALAVGLFSATAFFVDGSAARMTERALAPVAIDMQAGLISPLASSLMLTESLSAGPSLAAGQTLTVTLVAINGSGHPAPEVLVREQIPAQLTYVTGTTTLGGSRVSDVADSSPLSAGLNIGTLLAAGRTTVTYQARATTAISAVAGLPLHAQVTSAQDPEPAYANAGPAVSLAHLAALVSSVHGVAAADQLASLDLPAGRLRSTGVAPPQPLRVFAFDPIFLQHYPMVRLTSGGYPNGTVLLSPAAAAGLSLGVGGRVMLDLPGRATPLALTVGGIADFSKADPLFAARSADVQGEFIQVPYVLVVPLSAFESNFLPALKADSVAATPVLKSAPSLEVEARLDRGRLATDPTVAAVTTQGLKRSIERLAPGRVAVIDNVSDALAAATSDTILAKILFLFLGLPGVLLAAYLSRYAGSLLAQSRRREQATLRARGAQPRHLAGDLTFTAFGVGTIGSVLGLALGLATAVIVLGPSAVRTASPKGFALSMGLAVGAGILTTLVAIYLPGRRALVREVGEERRELEAVSSPPLWLRMRLDLGFLAAAALVWVVTNLAGGFKLTSAEGQAVSLSFYTLLAPLLAWLGLTLLAVRLLLRAVARLQWPASRRLGRLTTGVLVRSVARRSLALASGVIAVALAVAFGSSVALFIATYDAEKAADARFVIGSDIRITPSALTSRTSDYAAQLKVPGVTAVAPVAQSSNTLVGTEKRTLVAVDATTYSQAAPLADSFFPGGTAPAAMSALRNDPAAVLVSTEMARTFNIQTGDQVNVQLADRAGRPVPVTFHAAGVFKDFPGYPQGIDLVGNLAFYQTATGNDQASLFLIRTADSSSSGVAQVADLLRAGPGRSTPLLVETTATAINRDQSTLTAINLRGLGGLQALYTFLISGAGLAIFVFGLLLQRRKEYVTMRALGIRMAQLWALVLGEAAAVAVLSLVIGGAAGIVMAVMFVQILAPLFTIQPSTLTVPVAQLVTLAALVLGAMGIAVTLATRSLRRINPVELLREE